MPLPIRTDYCIKVIGLTEEEVATVIRMLHATGYPAEVVAVNGEPDALRGRLLAWADDLERDAPKPQAGGFFAEEIRRRVNGET